MVTLCNNQLSQKEIHYLICVMTTVYFGNFSLISKMGLCSTRSMYWGLMYSSHDWTGFQGKLPNHCYSWYTRNCLKKRHLQGHCKVNSCAINGFLWADRRIIEDNWRNCFYSVGNRKFCLWPIVISFWRSLIKRISDVNYHLFLQLSFVPLEMCRRYCVLTEQTGRGLCPLHWCSRNIYT